MRTWRILEIQKDYIDDRNRVDHAVPDNRVPGIYLQIPDIREHQESQTQSVETEKGEAVVDYTQDWTACIIGDVFYYWRVGCDSLDVVETLADGNENDYRRGLSADGF